jgi:hypothetical protein
VKQLISIVAVCITFQGAGQMKFGFEMPEGEDRVEIPFEEYNNLVVIPVYINNLIKLKFVVDTGVDTPILTEETFARILGLHYHFRTWYS